MLTTDSVTVAVEVPIYLTPALSDEQAAEGRYGAACVRYECTAK